MFFQLDWLVWDLLQWSGTFLSLSNRADLTGLHLCCDPMSLWLRGTSKTVSKIRECGRRQFFCLGNYFWKLNRIRIEFHTKNTNFCSSTSAFHQQTELICLSELQNTSNNWVQVCYLSQSNTVLMLGTWESVSILSGTNSQYFCVFML